MDAERQAGGTGSRVLVPGERGKAYLVEVERGGDPVQIVIRQIVVPVVLGVLDFLHRHAGARRQLLLVEAGAMLGLVEHVAKFVFKWNGWAGCH